MKKAYLKKELKGLYIDTVVRATLMALNSDLKSTEDTGYIVYTLVDIAGQRSTNEKLYDELMAKMPKDKISEDFPSKKDFVDLLQESMKDIKEQMLQKGIIK